MDIQLADVTIHIDDNLDKARRAEIEQKLRAVDGVVSVANPDDKPHLNVVEYNPDKVKALALLDVVKAEGVGAELVGL